MMEQKPCACGCGTMIDAYRADGKPRSYVQGHHLHPVNPKEQGGALPPCQDEDDRRK